MMEKKSYKLCKNDHFFAEFVIYKLEIVLEGVKKLNSSFFFFLLYNHRILNVVNHWSKEVKLEPTTGVELELTLDTSGAIQALHDLHFIELKGK